MYSERKNVPFVVKFLKNQTYRFRKSAWRPHERRRPLHTSLADRRKVRPCGRQCDTNSELSWVSEHFDWPNTKYGLGQCLSLCAGNAQCYANAAPMISWQMQQWCSYTTFVPSESLPIWSASPLRKFQPCTFLNSTFYISTYIQYLIFHNFLPLYVAPVLTYWCKT